jgi:Raf kinase inhibitor-like YbhB/YbcL family protein
MKKVCVSLIGFFACFLFTVSILAWQQGNKANVASVEGHVYEPKKVEPSDERVNRLRVPSGFTINKFALISNPRMIAVGSDGTVYVTQREPGTLSMLKDLDNDGIADVQKVIAEKKGLHGVALYQNKIYLATVKEVFVAPLNSDGTLGMLQILINDLPDGGQHPNRTLAVGPDNMLYISVGSTCNTCKETNEENATILRADLNGKNRKIFASGLRNTIGYGWHPQSKRLYGFDHGIDWLGDEEQPEEFNELTAGSQYGWPFVYAKSKIYPHGEPPPGYTKEMWAKMSKDPLLLYTPHSAPMQMAFYMAKQFPAEFHNDAFVAMRGSWNRNPPSGYEIARVRFDRSGAPLGIESFISGFLTKDEGSGEYAQFARLAGLAVAKDGSLLFSDDTNNVIYRVSYKTPKPNEMALPVITSKLSEFATIPSTIQVKSEAFSHNGTIPSAHSAYGENRSPVLSWSGAPGGTKSFVLMMEDPDALSPKPFVHWLVANLPANVTSLPASLPPGDKIDTVVGAKQGAANTSAIGYFGPRPPAGDPPHHYHFQVFALDTTLKLDTGFNRHTLLKAMQGHVLAKGEIIGTFQRQ